MYPAAGEAKLPETDGAMPRLKRRRWQAISAKAIVNPKMPKACMAITPATNVAYMKYNGGGHSEIIYMIDLGNPRARAVRQPQNPITVDGISSIHYMQVEAGGVRVWHVANIGPGRLITWDEIKRHFRGKAVVDPCVPLIDVPPAVDPKRAMDDTVVPSNELRPKIHRSHRNVKEAKRIKKLRVEEKKREREHKYQLSVEKFETRLDEETRLRCKW